MADAAPIFPAAPAPASPAPVVPAAAPAVSSPAGAAKLGKASEIAAELARAPAAPPAEPGPSGDKPADPPAPAPAADDVTAKRLARIAKEQKRARDELAAERAKFSFEQAATLAAAKKWSQLEEAKTKGDQLEVLRQLYSDGEITDGIYQRLTDHIYGQTSAETMTRADVEAMAEKKIRDAETKRADQNKAERQQAAEGAQIAYLEYVGGVLTREESKYPHVMAYPVSGAEVIRFTESYHAEHPGEAPTAEQVLEHFEAERAGRNPRKLQQQAAASHEAALGKTVTGDWKRDAPPTGVKVLSLRESLELAKREALGK